MCAAAVMHVTLKSVVDRAWAPELLDSRPLQKIKGRKYWQHRRVFVQLHQDKKQSRDLVAKNLYLSVPYVLHSFAELKLY